MCVCPSVLGVCVCVCMYVYVSCFRSFSGMSLFHGQCEARLLDHML